MKTKLLKIISVLLCVCVVIALFFATTRVSDITVQVVSSDVDAEKVDSALEKFVGKNIIALNKTEMVNALNTKCPELKVTGIVKKFPNQMVVQVRARNVLFAVKTSEGYDFIDEEGVYLGRNPLQNAFLSTTGAVYVELPVASNVPGQVYVAENGYNEIRLSLNTAFGLGFDGEQLSTLFQKITVENGAIKFHTRSGAILLMEACHVKTAEKTQYLLSAFVAASDKQKLMGTFVVFENADGALVVDWTEQKR